MMGDVAIYCSGPSLSKTLVPGTSAKYGHVIGVNHGAAYAAKLGERIDWFAGLDRYAINMVYKDHAFDPVKGLLCTRSSADEYKHGNHPLRRDLEVKQLHELPNALTFKQVGYTFIAALVFAENLGTHIDCYGVDMAGNDHVIGDDGRDNTKRWQREREFFETARMRLGERGVHVHLIGGMG